MFDVILEREKHFKTIKKESLKSQGIRIFPKELVYGFGQLQKFEFFPSLFLRKIGQENVFDDIWERKKVF